MLWFPLPILPSREPTKKSQEKLQGKNVLSPRNVNALWHFALRNKCEGGMTNPISFSGSTLLHQAHIQLCYRFHAFDFVVDF